MKKNKCPVDYNHKVRKIQFQTLEFNYCEECKEDIAEIKIKDETIEQKINRILSERMKEPVPIYVIADYTHSNRYNIRFRNKSNLEDVRRFNIPEPLRTTIQDVMTEIAKPRAIMYIFLNN